MNFLIIKPFNFLFSIFLFVIVFCFCACGNVSKPTQQKVNSYGLSEAFIVSQVSKDCLQEYNDVTDNFAKTLFCVCNFF